MKNSKIYPWVVVGLLWGVALLNYMDRQMLSTMRDAMAVDITELQSAANFGRLMGVFLWIYGCMSPIAGMVGDRMNRKWLIVGSLFVWSAVTYLMGIADTYNEVFFLRALMGISEALYIPAGLSLIADYHSDKSRSDGTCSIFLPESVLWNDNGFPYLSIILRSPAPVRSDTVLPPRRK